MADWVQGTGETVADGQGKGWRTWDKGKDGGLGTKERMVNLEQRKGWRISTRERGGRG